MTLAPGLAPVASPTKATMQDRLRFILNRLRERLWVKPLIICAISIAGVLLAGVADGTWLDSAVPKIELDTTRSFLTIMASSMLVIATFAVGAMVSAYGSASSQATPRAFTLLVSDDISQNALSAFLGGFIFSMVGLVAAQNGYYGRAGRFVLFGLTLLVLAIVLYHFVRWVDRVARLGRLGTTVDLIERVTADALRARRDAPTLGGAAVTERDAAGSAIRSPKIGYVQRVDLEALQTCAQKARGRFRVDALPGAFATPDRPLGTFFADGEVAALIDHEKMAAAFTIGDGRVFDDDPRFGLVVLAEVAARALSPGVNDPGTAIDIVGTFVRLFSLLAERPESGPDASSDSSAGPSPEPSRASRPDAADALGAPGGRPRFDRVEVPRLSMNDLFDDAFTAIARDGAGTVEVAVRLQKALHSLGSLPDSHPLAAELREAARLHARRALERAALAMKLPDDLEAVRRAAAN